MWEVARCLTVGVIAFFALQGFLDVTGLARSVPATGAVIGGLLAALQATRGSWQMAVSETDS